MKRLAPMLALVALPLVGCGGSAEPTTFESADGSFAVLFPSEPELDNETTNIAGYDLDLAFYVAEQDDMAFMVNHFDYGPLFAEAGLGDAAADLIDLDDAVDGAMSGVNGTATSVETITVDGREGRRIEFEGEQSGRALVGTAQVMVDGSDLYQILALGDGDIETMRAFVGSFDFLTEPAGDDE